MSHYLLTLYIFTVAQGHGLAPDTYRDRIILGPYATLEDCYKEGEAHLSGFRGAIDPATQSRDLMEYQCSKMR
jgi:hypothetical protein